MKLSTTLALAMALTAGTGAANAALQSRIGGQAYYDTIRNLTWVTDANLARSSGYDADGGMDLVQTQAWIASLNTASYLGASDWRLPNTAQPDATCSFQDGNGQGTGLGCTGSEMGHLYYVDGVTAFTPGPFANIQGNFYWSGTAYAPSPAFEWIFQFDGGTQAAGAPATPNYAAWAVRLGDIDPDGDGIAQPQDNCTLVANPTQLDADGDGYGNLCDADLNNSGLVTTADFGLLRSVLNQTSGSSAIAAAADLNGSGTVTTADFAILRARLNTPPGPSGLQSLCVPPVGAGTAHGSINAAQTWTAAASPHIVPFDISLNAPVTIEPCAVVRIVAGGTVTISSTGALIAAGVPGSPVTIEPKVAGAAWAAIRNAGGTLSLTHAIIRGGGAPLSTNPAFVGALNMQTTGVAAILHVDDVEITGSPTQGVYINGDVGFDPTSRNLRVHGSTGYPVHVNARLIGSIPSGTYTGNGHDAIAISGAASGPVRDAQTMRNRGVPYHVGSGPDGGQMDINTQLNGPAAVLTIEPGVTIQFPPGGLLSVASGFGGALIAIGGAGAQKIVFTSDRGAAAAAGDWLGVVFNDPVAGQSVLQNVRVEFAGGETAGNDASCPYPGRVGVNYAAIRIFGPPAGQFITSTEILGSARDGIDRGWRDDLQPSFLPGNTFTAVVGCKQTQPRTTNGTCPVTVPCP
jgi:hypothetical protein